MFTKIKTDIKKIQSFSIKSSGVLFDLTAAAVCTSGQLVVQVAQRANEALAGLLRKVLPVVVPLFVRPVTRHITAAVSQT